MQWFIRRRKARNAAAAAPPAESISAVHSGVTASVSTKSTRTKSKPSSPSKKQLLQEASDMLEAGKSPLRDSMKWTDPK